MFWVGFILDFLAAWVLAGVLGPAAHRDCARSGSEYAEDGTMMWIAVWFFLETMIMPAAIFSYPAVWVYRLWYSHVYTKGYTDALETL